MILENDEFFSGKQFSEKSGGAINAVNRAIKLCAASNDAEKLRSEVSRRNASVERRIEAGKFIRAKKAQCQKEREERNERNAYIRAVAKAAGVTPEWIKKHYAQDLKDIK